MKKVLSFAAVAIAVSALVGCSSVKQDALRVSAEAKLIPAKFKPTVKVIGEGKVAKGQADSEAYFWIIPTQWPKEFATNPNSGSLGFFDDPMKSAAVYQACKSSGADILLAPRFTEERYSSFLWFHKTRKVSVEGVPAKITGAEEIPVEEWPILFGAQSGIQIIKNK